MILFFVFQLEDILHPFTLAYEQTNRYLMAKMGKMVQLTHRLVGFLQVLEWAWDIATEYLRMKNYFTGSISEDFISTVRGIYEKIHGMDMDNTGERVLVASVSVVEKAINVSEALLEQYKLLMHLPDEVVRSPCANNKPKKNAKDRPINNRKLEKSKSKFAEHISGILTHNSVIFAPSTLYRGLSVFKHHSANVKTVLKGLLKMGLLVSFENGAVSSTKKSTVYAKWLPMPDDQVECQRFEQMLASFNDNNITSDTVIRSTTTVSLLPHKAIPRSVVINYLKSDRYARLNLDLGESVDEPAGDTGN